MLHIISGQVIICWVLICFSTAGICIRYQKIGDVNSTLVRMSHSGSTGATGSAMTTRGEIDEGKVGKR